MSDLNDFIEELELNGEVKELKKIKDIREKWEYNRLKKSVINELERILDDIKCEKYKDVESRIFSLQLEMDMEWIIILSKAVAILLGWLIKLVLKEI